MVKSVHSPKSSSLAGGKEAASASAELEVEDDEEADAEEAERLTAASAGARAAAASGARFLVAGHGAERTSMRDKST